MACSKAMNLSYNLRPQNDANSHQGLSYASNFLCKDNSAATSLPTQAFTRATDDPLRAQTSQGCIRMRSGAKIARRSVILRALGWKQRQGGGHGARTMDRGAGEFLFCAFRPEIRMAILISGEPNKRAKNKNHPPDASYFASYQR